MLHCQPGRDRAKCTSTLLHDLVSSPMRALIGWHTSELTPSLFLSLAQFGIASRRWHVRDVASSRLGRAIGVPTAIWLLAIATIFQCLHAEHRREYRRSGAAEQSISKLAASGWYPIAKSPKNSFRGPTGLKEAIYATISQTPASCRA